MSQNKLSAELKLRVVAAEAESLSLDLKSGKLWKGDYNRRIGFITEALNQAAKYKDQ